MMQLFLAWRPFLDPIDAHGVWWALLFPLAFFISIAYKGVRVGDLSFYWKQVAMMTAQIIIGMFSLGFVSFLFIEFVLPMMPMEM